MATRKNASKRTTRAKINIDIDDQSLNKAGRKARSVTRSFGKTTIILIVVFLLIGLLIGIGTCFFISRSDCFEIVGKDEITLTVGESYTDEGCKVVSFGKDISKDIQIETDLKRYEDGSFYGDETKTYYILYKSNDLKYGKVFTVTKIRLISFVEAGEEDEKNNAENLSQTINFSNASSILKGGIHG